MAQYTAVHPALVATFPESNAFSLKVIFPKEFLQTGGNYFELLSSELSSNHTTTTYTVKGKFTSFPQNSLFRLLRSHKNAGVDSKFVEKGTVQIKCKNSAESELFSNSFKELRIAAESSLPNGCYVIRSKKTNQALQALNGDVVEQRPVNNQSNQIWKAEAVGTNQYRFSLQDGSNKAMQANAFNQGELIRLGTYTGTDLQKWVLISNTDSYQINTSNGLAWDLRNYAADPQLQLWGNPNELGDHRLFRFESVGCPGAPPTGPCTTLRDADTPTNLTSGLTYRYYQSITNNDWCTATGLSNQAVVSTGSVSSFDLTPRQRNENFGFEFTGYIQVPTDGQYTFFLNSDDESRLSIGGQLVVAHSSCHGLTTAGQEPSGTICLRAGYHPVQLLYSQGGGGYGLNVYWQGPSTAKQVIPANALFRSGSPAACNFTVSASAPATVGCGATLTLNASCNCSDCTGVSYSWSTGQNGQSVNTTASTANGTATYMVTASKSGCNNTSATVSVAVTNCPPVNNNTITKTFMLTGIDGEEWSDGKKEYYMRQYPEFTKSSNEYIPPAGVTVTNIKNVRKIMSYWKELGGTHVSIPLEWKDTELKKDTFDFRHWDRIFMEADSHGLKVNVNIWPLLEFEHPFDARYVTTASWRYERDDVARISVPDGNGGHTEPIKHFMNYYSPRMANYRRWLNGVATYLATKASKIGYVAVVVNHHKEANYYLTDYTDYHPNTVSAWKDWHEATYSGRPELPKDGERNLQYNRWLQFRSETLINFVKEWAGIFKSKNIKTMLDVGSFTDDNDKRGTWALLGMLPPELDGVKHNPSYNYESPLETRIVASARPSLASVEWSNECNVQPCPSSLVPILTEKIKTSIDAGATDISFAIFDVPMDTFPPDNDLKKVVDALKSSGHWNKPIAPLPTNCVMEIKVTDAINNGGYNRGSIINNFNNFQNTHSGCTTWPTIKVINDLKNLN